MPRIGTKDHGTGEAAAGIKAEEGLMWPTDEQSPPVANVESYGQGGSGIGPDLVTEGDSNRSTPLKGGTMGKKGSE
jgi:hypothetical protein